MGFFPFVEAIDQMLPFLSFLKLKMRTWSPPEPAQLRVEREDINPRGGILRKHFLTTQVPKARKKINR